MQTQFVFWRRCRSLYLAGVCGVERCDVWLRTFARGSWDAWRMLALSIAAWFAPDTTYSIWSGFWQNAAFNAGFIVLFAAPLTATYHTCNNRTSWHAVRQPTGVHSSTKLPSGQRR